MTSLWLDRSNQIETDQFTPGAAYDDVVVGAGLTGLTTAALLSRAGRRVAVLEARQVGAVTSGNTTAKLSLLQGTTLSSLVRYHSERVAAAYVEGNREAFAWVLRYCDDHQVPVQRRDAYTYAGTRSGVTAVRQEFEVADRLGLEVMRVDADELPYPSYGAVRLAEQAQFDPLDLLTALAAELRSRDGVVVEGVRVVDIALESRVKVRTDAGTVTAENVILATGVPFLDRGLYFVKVTPKRSYALAFRVPGDVPRGMYLSADSPTRSLRTAQHGGQELLLVGGNGHTVGRHSQPPSELVADLVAWTERYFPGAERTHVWSAQDYQSHNHTPFVGKLPRGRGRVFLATGYNKWGMTNAVAAALRISSEVLGGNMPWARILSTRVSKPASAVNAVQANVAVVVAAVQGWAGAELRPLSGPALTPSEGEGVVGRLRGAPVGISTVYGKTCAISAICTHMGGVLRFNDLEKSWDCPLHGSRFAADGSVLEGPATRKLKRHPLDGSTEDVN
ncbi:MAG TPA: FAD-dependent oxidoreductase [Propionibacteriaceae bacterium]|nr:FAD-dependent oxidoreductase [Propionibacteriaceae bacterium]